MIVVCVVCLEAVCPFSQDSACVSKGFCYLYGVNECEACCSVVLIWSVVCLARGLAVAEGLCGPAASQPCLNIRD